jgi:Zn-dependent alcohol dehydrogenase
VDVEHGQRLQIEEIELPDPNADEVLVELYASGICHSQLHQMHNPDLPRPLLLGHEATGVVAATGSAVTHVREGDRVMVTWVPRDITVEYPAIPRTRFSFRGRDVEGPGIYTWAEHVLAHEQMVLPLSDDVSMEDTAIIGCATVTGVGAVLGSAKVQAGDTVAVFGVGGVGINVLAGAQIAQAGRIIAIDLADEKLEYAKEFGATDVINASEVDPVEAVKDLTGGGVDFAFDAIGAEVTLHQIVEVAKPGRLGASRGGTAVIVGVPQGPITIPQGFFPLGERHLIGSLGGSSHPVEDYPQYLEWYRQGALPLDKMVTKKYQSLDDINEGVRALQAGEISGRSVMVYKRPE